MLKVWQFIKSSLKKKLVLGILLLILIGGGYYVYQNYFVASSEVSYQTSTAEKGTLISSISSSGTITQGSSLSITSQATGVVSQVYVSNGDQVTAGQKIAEITPDLNSQQNQAAAWASYVSASNNLKNAENNVRNSQASLDKTLDDIHLFQYGNGGFDNVGSANETMEQREARTAKEVALNNAQNNLATSQSQINSAWLSYQQTSTTITAPLSGTVSGMTISVGSAISGSSTANSENGASSQTLGTVVLPNGKLQATVNLTEIDVTRVKAGQKVTLTMDAFRDKTFTGKVLSINTNGSVSSGVTTYPTVIEFDTIIDGAYPNMAVSATIITSVKDNVVLVPSSAVTTADGASTVRIMRNGNPEFVTVEVGESNDTQTEIISGINEGDLVVTGTSGGTTGTSTTTTTFPFGGGIGGGGGTVRINR
jgi:macrolide-specific efflux system membrane fusion protein